VSKQESNLSDAVIERSDCHPDAGVWVACGEWQIRVECAECQAEVKTFQLAAPYRQACDITGAEGDTILHCRRHFVGGKNTVTIIPAECTEPGCTCGMTSRAVIACAVCGSKMVGFALAGNKPTSWNPTQKVLSVN
jgi:hypothetical protein